MATIETDRPRSQTSSRTSAYRESETKLSLKTTEFWAMAGVIAAILVAAAVSDSLGDVRAWTLVAGVAAAYIISRGLAKSGSRYTDGEDDSARR
jgi:hypothetical protein